MTNETTTVAPDVTNAHASAETMFVLDTTCKPGEDRTHDAIYYGRPMPFRFTYGQPLELPRSVALRFLKTESFRLTDETGAPLKFEPTPKQPNELQAGERFELKDNEVVARLDELTIDALLVRATTIPGGEKLRKQSSKKTIIAFIVEQTKEKRQATTPAEEDEDSFVPEEMDLD